ncbi:MAG: Phosphoribosylglycinamide formyltransferase [Firmicutes bacterium ADurb.Bin182]|nr:MAG: Phosphoribosylglycinamide formyltransferase [Firmicutes bacterium ADurb.Bin182]
MLMRIAVMASGEGTGLQALLDAERNGRLKSGRIVLVLSEREDSESLDRARRFGIKAVAVIRRQFNDRAAFEKRLLEALKSSDIDVIVLAGFFCILSGEFISHYPGRIINVHPSLIPSFSGKGCYGLKVHEAALKAGVKVSGATVHVVNEIPDGGKILMQKAVEVMPDDTPYTLQQRVKEQAEWKILPEAAELFCKSLKERKQGE